MAYNYIEEKKRQMNRVAERKGVNICRLQWEIQECVRKALKEGEISRKEYDDFVDHCNRYHSGLVKKI